MEKTNLSCVDGQNDNTNSPAVPTAHLYPLSYNEAAALTWGSDILKAKSITAPEGSAGWWWLRSSLYVNIAFCVDDDGNLTRRPVVLLLGARPAFNLDLSKVLFTSAAVGGKSVAAVGGDLNSVATTAPTTGWKLTLLDSSRDSFSITTTALTSASATVSYANAKTGTNEYISAMIVDEGAITYYGRILQLDGTTNGASGTVTVNIPSGVTLDGDTTLRIFNEQFNGDRSDATALVPTSSAYTDYASPLRTVTAPAPAAPTITGPAVDQTVTVAVGKTGTMSYTDGSATGYQWYINRNNGKGFVPISGATGASYTTSAVTLSNNGYQYYCIATNGYGSATGPVFTLNVVAQPDVPATGGNSVPGLWIGIALLSAGSIVLVRRKRRSN